MKLLLVLGSDKTYNLISLYVRPLGFELIRYHNAIKAMDNLDEADPSGIIISAQDFPRHWKTIVQFVRNERAKDVCPIIILKGDNFPLEETSKAFYLGVSGIVAESLDNASEVDRLQGILSRYMPVEEKRRTRRYHTENWQRINFVFANPKDQTIITGEVKTISSGGLSFLPDYSNVMKDIMLNMELTECSLRAGDSILSPVCRLARTGRIVSMQFLSFQDKEQEILDEYLESLPLEELKYKENAEISSRL
ncbi:MAG: PilZ domain-containing protein [Treponema sp.]|jgi:DNA-binding response OmpR family regulator|nr:PilZ domain-containing protein [Treponema sp.]